MSYVILRPANKIKSLEHLGLVLGHNTREMNAPNADIDRRDQVFDLLRPDLGPDITTDHIKQAIEKRRTECGNPSANQSRLTRRFSDWIPPTEEQLAGLSEAQRKRRLRRPKDNAEAGVIAVEMLCGASPEFFQALPDAEVMRWAHQSLNFLQNEFTAANVVSCMFHGDETTPHLQFVVVPLVHKVDARRKGGEKSAPVWMYSARDLVGGAAANLGELQTRYAKHMQAAGFDLRRGEQRQGKLRHQALKTLYPKLNQVEAREAAAVKREQELAQEAAALKAWGADLASVARDLEEHERKLRDDQAAAEMKAADLARRDEEVKRRAAHRALLQAVTASPDMRLTPAGDSFRIEPFEKLTAEQVAAFMMPWRSDEIAFGRNLALMQERMRDREASVREREEGQKRLAAGNAAKQAELDRRARGLNEQEAAALALKAALTATVAESAERATDLDRREASLTDREHRILSDEQAADDTLAAAQATKAEADAIMAGVRAFADGTIRDAGHTDDGRRGFIFRPGMPQTEVDAMLNGLAEGGVYDVVWDFVKEDAERRRQEMHVALKGFLAQKLNSLMQPVLGGLAQLEAGVGSLSSEHKARLQGLQVTAQTVKKQTDAQVAKAPAAFGAWLQDEGLGY